MLAIGEYVELIESQQKSLTVKGRLWMIVTALVSQPKLPDSQSLQYFQ